MGVFAEGTVTVDTAAGCNVVAAAVEYLFLVAYTIAPARLKAARTPRVPRTIAGVLLLAP